MTRKLYWLAFKVGDEYKLSPYRCESRQDAMRHGMEHVLDRELAHKEYLGGDKYSIADIATWPWYGTLVRGEIYEAGRFLQVNSYTNVVRWAEDIFERPAVQRGRRVNRTWGEESERVRERHSAADFAKTP